MNKKTRACEFSRAERWKIRERDKNCCIFCRMLGNSGYPPTQIAHYKGRAQNGLGIEKNGALVCVPHHQRLDNSPKRKVMLGLFKSYLMGCYDDWNEEDLVYTKWGWTNECH